MLADGDEIVAPSPEAERAWPALEPRATHTRLHLFDVAGFALAPGFAYRSDRFWNLLWRMKL